jgi:hypothetical protein
MYYVLSIMGTSYARNLFMKSSLRGLSPQANYTDGTTAACRRS